MSETTALDKRIRRRITGRPLSFFAVTAPGLAELCAAELTAPPVAISSVKAEAEPGGVGFTARLHDAYRANLHLRTATRILMRIDTVRATRFDGLAARLAAIPWELYLKPGTPVRVTAAVRHCRLHHRRAIAERTEAAIEARMADWGPAKASGAPPAPQTIFIRGVDDRFTVSIDTSGEMLYRRGLKASVGRAPIRETLAAAILRLGGLAPGRPLVDPLCGAGTFALEGAMILAGIPPGRYREFAFMDWPSFQPGRWRHLLREADATVRYPDRPVVFASDCDPAACSTLARQVRTVGLDQTVAVACADARTVRPPTGWPPGLVVIDPPYGLRLSTPEASAELFAELSAHLSAAFRGWRTAIILPDPRLADSAPSGLSARRIIHGGRRRILLTGRIR